MASIIIIFNEIMQQLLDCSGDATMRSYFITQCVNISLIANISE